MSGKHFALIAVAAAVVSLVVGAAAGRTFRPERAIAQEGVRVVKQMAVVDSDGNLRGLVSADGEEPMPSIYFYDAEGTHRVGCEPGIEFGQFPLQDAVEEGPRLAAPEFKGIGRRQGVPADLRGMLHHRELNRAGFADTQRAHARPSSAFCPGFGQTLRSPSICS